MFRLILLIFVVTFQAIISEESVHFRFQRQLPNCSDGSPAVAGCFRPQLTCGKGYQCETKTGLCCRPRLPTCPSGIQASAACINGGCNLGLRCFAVGTQALCCRVCPNNATSTAVCTSNAQCTANSECNLFGGSQGLCCPSISTSSPATISRTPPALPTCPNGIQATAGCINGGCNLGLRCFVTERQSLCCRVCPNNATSSGICMNNSQCTAANSQCNLFAGMQGLCCPSMPTTPLTPSSTKTRVTLSSVSTQKTSTKVMPSSISAPKTSSSSSKRSTSGTTVTSRNTPRSSSVSSRSSKGTTRLLPKSNRN